MQVDEGRVDSLLQCPKSICTAFMQLISDVLQPDVAPKHDALGGDVAASIVAAVRFQVRGSIMIWAL